MFITLEKISMTAVLRRQKFFFSIKNFNEIKDGIRDIEDIENIQWKRRRKKMCYYLSNQR